MKNLSLESNSLPFIIPQTKFEAIISGDVGGIGLRAKANVSQQILNSDHYGCLPVAPLLGILVFLES